MIIALAAALTVSVPLSVSPAQAQQGLQRVMGGVPVYYRLPGLQTRWHLLGTFSRQFARLMAEQLRSQGYQAKVGPINF